MFVISCELEHEIIDRHVSTIIASKGRCETEDEWSTSGVLNFTEIAEAKTPEVANVYVKLQSKRRYIQQRFVS